MANAAQPVLGGPEFLRLLARLSDGAMPASSPALTDRLGQWVDWSRAVALSGALGGRLPEYSPKDLIWLELQPDEHILYDPWTQPVRFVCKTNPTPILKVWSFGPDRRDDSQQGDDISFTVDLPARSYPPATEQHNGASNKLLQPTP